ncbi:MAG: type II TA system antitoxin MqsA family protein [Erysipelotrichaceae bacterium]
MIKRKVFCENCRKEVEYITEEKKMTATIRSEEYHYKGKEAKCSECGCEVYVEEINDDNLKKLYDEYRKINDLISLEDIRSIPEKYNIGKRPLSQLLGWGEHTFTHYYEGDIPTRQYSDVLKRISVDPDFYLNILNNYKDRLPSESSYKKSLKAVKKLTEINNETFKNKIEAVTGYLLNQCEDITPLALQKSLYYIQGFYYAFFDKFIFDSDCEAWAYGPVYRDIYYKYRDYRFNPIAKTVFFDCSVFTVQEKAVLDSIIRNISCYSGKVLETFTHNETPWIITRGDVKDCEPCDSVITKDIIGNYFKKIKEKYDMVSPKDIQLYSKDMFQNLI